MGATQPPEITQPLGAWSADDREAPGGMARHRHTELNTIQLRVQVGSFRAEFLGFGFIDGSKWWRNYLHAHTHYEICYAFAGRGVFRMLGRDYPVQQGEVFIAKPGEEHEILADERDPMGIYFWSYTLTPDNGPRPAERLIHAPHRARDEAVDRLLHAFVESRKWVAPAPGMGRTLELMTEEIVRREPGFAGVLEGLGAKLILDTARASLEAPLPAEEAAPRSAEPHQALIAQATRYMRDNLSRPLSVQDVAAQVNLSERHFSRIFREKTQLSLLEALTRLRMEAAAQLLLDRNLPIKEIAERVGIPDVRYFTTVFRKRMGRPPAQYRARGGTSFGDPLREDYAAKGGPRAASIPPEKLRQQARLGKGSQAKGRKLKR